MIYMAESCNPTTVWAPFGTFSQMVVTGTGRMLLLKGQVSLDRHGDVVGVGDMNCQLEQVLSNISNLLAAVNGRMSDILCLNQYTTDVRMFMACGPIRQRFFQDPYPVTTTVEVLSLYDERLLIEIAAIAEIPIDRSTPAEAAVEMHE